MAVAFGGQDFSSLRKSQLIMGELFTDSTFPANDTSIFLPKGTTADEIAGFEMEREVEWKRPWQICSDPKLLADGQLSRLDARQGSVGDCWFVAACSLLASVEGFWHRVVPDYKQQEWDPKNPDNYCGIFHFRFWRVGKWVDVVIDDLLPTVNGQLIFAHSRTRNVFWCALLEKAYAKLNGCYQSLFCGDVGEGLVDLTSGILEIMHFSSGDYFDEEKKQDFFQVLLKQADGRGLVCCAIDTPMKAAGGLLTDHVYEMTAVRQVNLNNSFVLLTGRKQMNMVRLRNPWGYNEWNGRFSDGSPEWNLISGSERERLGLHRQEDSELWMTFDDFLSQFTSISVCHLPLKTPVFTFSRHRLCHESLVYGRWTKEDCLGVADLFSGNVEKMDTIFSNHTYCLDIESEADEILADVSWVGPSGIRQLTEDSFITLNIFKVDELDGVPKFVSSSGRCNYSASVRGTRVGPGTCLVIPTTFKPGQTGQYLVRILSTCNVNLQKGTL